MNTCVKDLPETLKNEIINVDRIVKNNSFKLTQLKETADNMLEGQKYDLSDKMNKVVLKMKQILVRC